MGAKKKGKGKGKGKQEEEEDLSTKQLIQLYKKYSLSKEAPISKVLENKLLDCISNDEHLKEILINEKIGGKGAVALGDALKEVNKLKGYQHCKAIRFWEADIGDEGISGVSNYIIETNNTKVELIEVLNCGISPLGCESIARMFDQSLMTGIQYLTLDFNQFGNEGLFQLMYVIKNNITLNYLSLAYCNIDKDGIKHFKDYLMNPLSNLNVLILTGNSLENPGVNELFQFLFNHNALESLFLENTRWGGDEDTLFNFLTLLENNKKLFEYKIKRNYLTEKSMFVNKKDMKSIMEVYKSESGKHLFDIEIDQFYPKEIIDMYFKAKKGKKRPKKSKKKKGKKKKKK